MLRQILATTTLLTIAACAPSGSSPTLSADTAPSPPTAAPELDCGTGQACFERGVASYEGAEPAPSATAEDLALATRYFIRACELGYDRGCHTAGNMFRLGIGVDKDLLRAQRYYESVCDDTYPEACHNLGLVNRELAADSSPVRQL